MAEVASVFWWRGTIGNITIDKNGVVRKAQGKRSVVAIRTQENSREFGIASRQACLIRRALRPLGGDRYVSSRLTGVVLQGIKLDDKHLRGDRFLSKREAQMVLPGFQFYKNCPFYPDMLDCSFPAGATDRKITTIVALLDLNPNYLSIHSVKVLDGYHPEYEQKIDRELTTIVAVGMRHYQQINDHLLELIGGRKGTIVAVF